MGSVAQVAESRVQEVAAPAAYASRRAVVVEWLLLALGMVAFQVLIRHDIFADGGLRFDELALLLDHGILSPKRYSLIGPLFSTPLYLMGHFYSSPARWAVRYNSVLFSLSLLVIYWVLRRWIDRALLRAFLLILVAASMFPAHVMTYYGETFTAVFVAVGLLVAEFGRPLVGWIAVVLGVANTTAAIAGLVVMVARRILETGRWRYVLAIIATIVVMCGENWIRRGSPFATAYESGFDNPFLFGLLGILFSFGKGLVFFVPGMFLPVKRWMVGAGESMRRLYSVHLLWISFVVGLVLLYANWYGWDGGWFWGPRFFLIASFPASLALAVRLRSPNGVLGANLLTLGAFALSTWVDINGAVYNMTGVAPACLFTGHIELCDYMLPLSPLWHPFFAAQPLNLANVLFIAYCALVFVYLAAPLARVTFSQLSAAMSRASIVRSLPRF
jgi:hypothetical protein